MRVRCAEIDRIKLSSIPEEERRAFLLLGNALNEITVFQKLLEMTRPKKVTNDLLFDDVAFGQMSIVLRVLLGKLHEGWELFTARVLQTPTVYSRHIRGLDDEAQSAINDLKKHFGNGSILTKIRNSLSFHYKDKDNLVDESFSSLPNGEPLRFYLSESVGNTFFYACERLVDHAVLRLVTAHAANERPSVTIVDELGAVEHLFGIALRVADQLNLVFQRCTESIARTHDCFTILPGVDEIQGLPRISTFTIPFFFADAPLEHSISPNAAK